MPEAGAIRRSLHDIEGNSGFFDLLSPQNRAATRARCAVVRSRETHRVYLFVREDVPNATHWREGMEIIGFEGLRSCLPRHNRSVLPTWKVG